MRRRLLLCCLGLLLAPVGQAGVLRQSDVQYRDGVYHVQMVMEIEAGFDSVRAIITDYGHMARLSRLISASSLVDAPGGGIRRRLDCHMCLLFFCYDPVIVEDVEEVGVDTMITTVVPALSDFRSGRSEWRITSLGPARTLVRFDYYIEPDFWIPPLIGPLLIKSKLQGEAEYTINRIEALARD